MIMRQCVSDIYIECSVIVCAVQESIDFIIIIITLRIIQIGLSLN